MVRVINDYPEAGQGNHVPGYDCPCEPIEEVMSNGWIILTHQDVL